MAININVRKYNEKLFCEHYKKEQYNETLTYENKVNDIFRAKILGNITSDGTIIASGVILDNSTLQIETHDTIKEVKEGDIIKIKQIGKVYLITQIQEIVEEENLEYMPYGVSNKALVLSLRGKGKNK